MLTCGPHAPCEKLINLTKAFFTAASVEIYAVPVRDLSRSARTPPHGGETHIDLDVIRSKFIPLSSESGNEGAVETVVADLIGDVGPSCPSASHAVNTLVFAGSDSDKQFPLEQVTAASGGWQMLLL